MGCIVGCFEGQTNYLKKKGLWPDIGGVVMELTFNDAGKVSRIGWEWYPFPEVKDDWKNWYVPEIEELNFEADALETLIQIEKEPV
jgi:hypothetical protein